MSKHQIWDPKVYDAKHGYVSQRGVELIDVLAPLGRERILDIGCGTGHVTAEIAGRAHECVGLDSSAEMIAQARKAHPHLEFVHADAAEMTFAAPFDAVFSHAALHWMSRPEAVAAAVTNVLKTNGRFVAEFGGKGNTQAILAALYLAFEANGIADADERNPWFFPSIAEYTAILESAGLETTSAMLFDRPAALEPGKGALRNWLETFAGVFFDGVPARKRNDVYEYMEFLLQDSLFIRDRWYVDYRRIRIVAYKRAVP